MTNHVHLIIATKDIELQDILRDLKKFSSKAIITAIKENQQESRKEWMLDLFEKAGEKNSNNVHYQFWQQHNHPIILDSNFLLDQKLNYVHDNPVKAGFVEKPEDYLYSSARDYMGIKGLIDIEIME